MSLVQALHGGEITASVEAWKLVLHSMPLLEVSSVQMWVCVACLNAKPKGFLFLSLFGRSGGLCVNRYWPQRCVLRY